MFLKQPRPPIVFVDVRTALLVTVVPPLTRLTHAKPSLPGNTPSSMNPKFSVSRGLVATNTGDHLIRPYTGKASP